MKQGKGECCGCGVCALACPHGAVVMTPDSEGFAYARVDRARCTGCGLCQAVCPMGEQPAPGCENRFFAAQAKDDALRFSSSSGGVFPVLAREVLARGGVVFGAAIGPDGAVRHREVQGLEGLAALQKTKYVQSSLDGCVEAAKRYADSGRLVLFTGTPCQCDAVRRYVGGSENLILADLVCYGVPSPLVWEKYIKELEKTYRGRFSGFSFRDKRAKDNGHTVAAYIDGQETAWPMGHDPFCRAFSRSHSLRPSCYECRFCTPDRESDLTMGDFWGIEKVYPEMDDGMGTSLVIIHSGKGAALWEAVQGQLRCAECQREDTLQPRLRTPTLHPGISRAWFWRLCRVLPLRITEKILRK